MTRFLERFFLLLLLKYAPLGQHRMGPDKFFGFLCPRCVVAVRRETISGWR